MGGGAGGYGMGKRANVATQCKKESHERNAARLESEKTQVVKGV